MKEIAVTVDVDWAPDAAIDFTADLLARHGVRSTWFLTHDSPAIDRLRARPHLFDLGIHPNFLPGSSHGATSEEVLAYCMKLVPDAVAMRAHALVQSTPLLDTILRKTPLRCDVSLLLPYASYLEAVELQWQGTTMLRVPYHWEDDMEMLRDRPSWELETGLAGDGLRVFDFHPIHVFLNSSDMRPYEALKAAVHPVSAASEAQMADFVNAKEGSRTMLTALARYLGQTGGAKTIRDIYDNWKGGQR